MEETDVDRRAQGVQRVRISDGNGGFRTVHTAALSTSKLIASILGLLAMVASISVAAVTVGMKAQIEEQVRDQRSPLNREIEAVVDDRCNELREEINLELRSIDKRLAEIQALAKANQQQPSE